MNFKIFATLLFTSCNISFAESHRQIDLSDYSKKEVAAFAYRTSCRLFDEIADLEKNPNSQKARTLLLIYEPLLEQLVLILKGLKERGADLAFVYLDDTPKRGQIAVRFKKG